MSRRVAESAIEAVARRFSAAVEAGAGAAGARLNVGGRRVALDVMTLRWRVAGRAGVIKPRLRFDKVALGLVARLRAALRGLVPDGRTIVVTITAPIRVPARTAAAIEGEVQRLLAKGARPGRVRAMLHGNQVQVRVLAGDRSLASKVIGFVHNPDSDPGVLIELTRQLLAGVGSGRRSSAEPAGERWLIIDNRRQLLPVETYQTVCSQLGMRTRFARLLVVLPVGRIESLQ